MKTKKSIIIKISLLLTFLSVIVVIVSLLFVPNNKKVNTKLVPSSSYYNSDQAQIVSSDAGTNVSYISMTDAIASPDVSYSSKIITIRTAEELYAFSVYANSYSQFLTYNYELMCNIDYDGVGDFIPIAWASGEFSGTFNGNGYEIKSLSLLNIAGNNYDTYANMTYYAMFSVNSGTITNLGLVEPTATVAYPLTKLRENGGVSFLVGNNKGTVSYSFVVDLGNAQEEESGIVAAGGYRIAGLVHTNSGNMIEDYIICSTLLNYSITDAIEWSEIALDVTASSNITNCYFYNATIDDANSNVANGEFSYVLESGFQSVVRTNYQGTYASSKDDLIDAYKTLAGWYTPDSYGNLSKHIGLEFAIRRGISYTNNSNKFEINNIKDFLYMYELFNIDDFMASNAITYEITSDINLLSVPATAYTYNKAIGATITGKEQAAGSPILSTTSNSKYPTIYNADVMNTTRVVTTTGVDCYGMFNYVTGTISNLNVIPANMNLTDADNSTSNANIKAIGALSGYVEGGTIDNVNVYLNVLNADYLGEYYIGGITGILGGNGTIRNSTASGNITLDEVDSTVIGATSSYMKGIAIGGAIGYIESSLGNVYEILSAVNINSNLGTDSVTYAIGGVIGAGYTKKCEKLENQGTISIGDSSITPAYSSLYVSGVIGRHLGITEQVNYFTNQGEINVYVYNRAANLKTMVCGIVNVDIQTSGVASSLKNGSGNYIYYASSLVNGASINIQSISRSLVYSSGVNINSENGFKTEINGIYNVSYTKKYNNSTTKQSTALAAQSINMRFAPNYAGVVSVNGATSTNDVKLETVYNLRDINYTMSANNTTATDMIYSGVINGEYISYTDIRNEGNMTFDFSSYAPNNSSTNISINGVFNTLSNGCNAYSIFNGGDITIKYGTATLTANLYISGICKENLSVNSTNEQNPLYRDFDNTLKGTLDTVINDGDILVTSDNLNTSLSTNGSQSVSDNLMASIYAGGISYMNSGIISNSFNLGDIVLEAFSKKASSIYSIGGIACVSSGNYSQIRDSANNGTLKAINMSNSYSTTMNVGGIIATNTSDSSNINGLIAFTINYGTIICFNGTTSMTSPTIAGAHAIASGIIANGICNAVNVVNYGTIYTSEVAGSLIGLVGLSGFDNVSVSLANTINYGNIYALEKHHYDQATIYYPTFDDVSNLRYYTYGEYNSDRNVYQYCGAMVGIIDFNSRNNFNIRYLINFFNGSTISASELNVPSTAVDTSTFITINGSTDTFGKGSVKYAPLSTISDDLGNIGVFSKEFVFRKAIDGIGIDENIITDSYIADFFQFVRFDKVNTYLLDLIGWRTIAYADAAEAFARNILGVSELINKTNSVITSNDIISDEFTSRTWVDSIDTTLLDSFIEEALKSNELSSDLLDILNYVFFDQTNYSSITSSIRQSVITSILNYYDSVNADYYDVLQALLYDELLAKVVAEDNSNYKNILTKIDEILSSSDNLGVILENYLEVLQNDLTLLDPVFSEELGDYYITKKMNVIELLIDGLSDDVMNKLLESTSSSAADSLKYSAYLTAHPEDAKELYTLLIQYNNIGTNEAYRNAINKSLQKYQTIDIIEENTYTTVNDTFTELTGSTYINGTSISYSKDYTELWNIVKNNTELQSYIATNYFRNVTDPTSSIVYSALIAKATEYNNTYQSQDEPSGTTNGLNNTEGVYRVTNASSQIKNRYIYTPDSVANEGTYYYGPFMANGNTFAVNISDTNYLGRDIYNAALITSTQRNYVPMFISTNENITKDKILASNTTATNKNYYPFYWNDYGGGGDSANQWVSDYILDNSANDGYAYLYKNYTTGTYVTDYFDFRPNYYPTTNQDTSATNTTITYNGSSVTISLASNRNQSFSNLNGSGTQNHPLRDYYLKAYCTTSMITGLWSILDIWKSGNTIVGCYLTSKSGDSISGTSYNGVQTTQYTYYQISDLVNLDGIRTKGLSGNIEDADEKAIISALMTQILSTTAGKKVVLKALAEYSNTNDFTASQSASASMLISALDNTLFAQNSVQDVFAGLQTSSIESIMTSDTVTLKEYLDNLIKDEVYSSKQLLSMSAATDQELFRTLLLMLLNPVDNDTGTNTASNKDLAYFIYEYANYLKAIGKTNAEILSMINSVKEVDLEAFEILSKLDFTYILSVDDIASITGTDYIFYKFEVTHNGIIYVNGEESDDFGSAQGISSWIIPANTAIEISGSGLVSDCELYGVNSITTGTSSMYYLLELTFSNGNITINGNRQLAAENEEITAQWVLECNKTYPITTTNKPAITNVNMYEKNIIELEADAIVQVKYSGTVSINGISHTNSSSAEYSWELEAGSYPVTIAEGTTIEYLFYPTIYHLPQVTYRMGNASGTGSNVSFESGEEQTLPVTATQTYTRDSNTVYTYGSLSFSNVPSGAKIELTLTASGNFNITTTTSFGSNTITTATIDSYSGESWLFRGSAGSRTISQIMLVYTLPYGTDTITYTQYLFSSANNNSTSITGSPSNIASYILDDASTQEISDNSLSITGLSNQNHTCVFICSSGTEVSPADLGASTTPIEANIFTRVDITSVSQVADLDEIEKNYNDYYPQLSAYGNYIASNLINVNNSTTFTITEPSIVFVHATGVGSITLDNYTRTTTDTPYYYAYYLPIAGTYTVAINNATVDEILIVNIDSKLIVSVDKATIEYNDGESTDLIYTGLEYTKLTSYTFNLYTDEEIKETILLLFPTMKDSTDGYYLFKNDIFTSNLKDLVNLFAIADYTDINGAFGRLLNAFTGSMDDLILSIDSEAIKKIIAKEMISISINDQINYSNVYLLSEAAYLGNDYLTYSKANQLTKTKIYEILNLYTPAGGSQGYYQFITSDTSIDSDKFLELMQHLGLTSNIDGYGIYALASSKGIKNGIFIPDNLELSSMDTYYDVNEELGEYVLTEELSSTWRGGTEDNPNNRTEDSINYQFYVNMKQLLLSISTSIFTLDLEYNDIIINSSSEQITENQITYYVSSSMFDYLKSVSSVDINKIVLADNASVGNNSTIISLSNKTIDGNTITASKAIRIYAEDTTIYTDYDVIFILVEATSPTLTIDKAVIEYSGDTVTLTYTASLPNGMDMKQFVTVNGDGENNTWMFNVNAKNNGIIKNGIATIVIDIDKSMPQGDVVFTVNVYGDIASVTAVKNANTENAIVEFYFDGEDLKDTINSNKIVTSIIPFGMAYNSDDLTLLTSESFYLYKFEISDNAIVSIYAEKSIDTKGLMTYTVTYNVTSESGSTMEYVHVLKESQFFDEGSTYASLYADGNVVSTLSSGTFTYSLDDDTCTETSGSYSWSLADDMKIGVAFNRGIEPQYRIKYVLSNFYTLGENVIFDINLDKSSTDAASNVTYAGMTVTVSDNNEPGIYTFVYTYQNTGIWEGEEYERYYEFPELVVEKLFSRDALLKQLTFLDQSIVIGNTATVMLPEIALIPNTDGDPNYYSSNDVLYSDVFNSSSRSINIRTDGIVYNNGSDSTDITDYYTIGTVADSDLSYYAPTFKINDYAQIYQYTTITKLTTYGSSQTTYDTNILSSHIASETLLYVPFENASGEISVFLVKLNANYEWQAVYTTDYDGTNEDAKLYTYTSTLPTTYTATNTTSIAEEGYAGFNGYKVASFAGDPTKNQSLYMDYIGTPLDGHFWYVSYLVMSESALHGDTEGAGNIRYFHISIIDSTNNVYFNVTIYTPADFTLEDIYLTIYENMYNRLNEYVGYKQISAYATYAGLSSDGLKMYTLRYKLQTLPQGYFYFYVSIPSAYVASSYTDKQNQIDSSIEPGKSESGAFVPYSSIITQNISLSIVITEGENVDSSNWGIKTTESYNALATYKGIFGSDEE
ncbi:MAG: hypothetical protein ACI35W_07200 [Anaeroplasmataceae bacterium]